MKRVKISILPPVILIELLGFLACVSNFHLLQAGERTSSRAFLFMRTNTKTGGIFCAEYENTYTLLMAITVKTHKIQRQIKFS